jgi:uncharacterized protein YydD (DUF2326 family)
MIHRVFSSLSGFKELEFRPGLNVLIAQKEAGATDQQTRNRAGKSSLIELIHFLLGAEARKDSVFRSEWLVGESFGLTFDLGGEPMTTVRSGGDISKLRVEGEGAVQGRDRLSNSAWRALLGEEMFRLINAPERDGRTPTFRSLFAYFVRRQESGAFTTPEKQASQQQVGDYQRALLFLLGLDWRLAAEWQQVRDREKTLRALKKAAGGGALGTLVGKASDLRTQVAVASSRLGEMKAQVESFRVLPKYGELEEEADRLTRQLSDISNSDVIDLASIRDLETAMQSEAPPPLDQLAAVYESAGVSLPGVAIRRFDEVRAFHESVVRNRRDYLASELQATRARMASREHAKRSLDERRSTLMALLKSHGALDHFSKLQAETARKEAEVELLRRRFAAAEQLEGARDEIDIDRRRLTLRLRRDFTEQSERLAEAILAFEETSKRLYESAGRMEVEASPNGPQFQFPMQGSRSKGIKNMQIFCFDMMLMQLCALRGIGPGFLVHDSHLFDGVDGRQVVSALKVGAEMAERLGFQYIVTMNEDDAFKETTEGFDVRDHVLPVVLTDAKEDGGLFGFRF